MVNKTKAFEQIVRLLTLRVLVGPIGPHCYHKRKSESFEQARFPFATRENSCRSVASQLRQQQPPRHCDTKHLNYSQSLHINIESIMAGGDHDEPPVNLEARVKDLEQRLQKNETALIKLENLHKRDKIDLDDIFTRLKNYVDKLGNFLNEVGALKLEIPSQNQRLAGTDASTFATRDSHLLDDEPKRKNCKVTH